MSARITGNNRIYHVIMRGVNRCSIFEDDTDRKTFLKYLGEVRHTFHITLYCYCLMGNHVHLLVRDNEDCLSQAMHFLNMHYAVYFNSKYERVGHLMQGRFKSKPVENQDYFYTLIRYILFNPRKAYGCPPSDYRWSSYRDYIYGYSTTDTQTLWAELGGRSGFIELMKSVPDALPDDCELESSLPDAEAASLISDVAGTDPSDLIKLPRTKRNNVLRMLKRNKLPLRQISRLTGISRSVIQRA